MIVVITTSECNEDTGNTELLASHGVNIDTGENIVLPNVHPSELGATIDRRMNEWVLPSET